MSLCLFRLIETVFRLIEYRELGFLKTDFDFFKITFSKVFLNFSLSLRFGLGSTSDFCHFWSFFLQGFSLQISVRPFYPSFCFYFLISCILIWGFRTNTYMGFLMIKAIFSEIDLWVLFLWYFYHDLCWKIWSIWSFGMNSNF